MTWGHRPSFIATHLLGEAVARGGHLQALSVRAQTTMYGSTAGPYGGIGGAAMTTFTITEIHLRDTTRSGVASVLVYAANERFLGWCPADRSAEVTAIKDAFPRLRADMPGLHTDPATCPIDLPARLVEKR